MSITFVSHVRELNDLESRAVELAVAPRDVLGGERALVVSLGDENGEPFVEISRGPHSPVKIVFRKEDSTDHKPGPKKRR